MSDFDPVCDRIHGLIRNCIPDSDSFNVAVLPLSTFTENDLHARRKKKCFNDGNIFTL